jgi:Zn-dependent membrane protease YugP
MLGIGFGPILLMLVIGLMSYTVQKRFQKKFKRYAETPLSSGLTGKEVAERMLQENGIRDVSINVSEGTLTDHYNPGNRTINLSKDVYQGRSIASAAIAAHECGHAVQHATNYSFLQLRSALVPVVSVSNQYVPYLLIGGILGIWLFNIPHILLAGIILFAASTVFSFVTLPVEFDATKRGLNWLETANITTGKEHEMAKDGLNAAAKTYVVAALASLLTLLYYIMIFMGFSGDD